MKTIRSQRLRRRAILVLIVLAASLGIATTMAAAVQGAAGPFPGDLPASAAPSRGEGPPAEASSTRGAYNDAVAGYALVRGAGTPDETFSYNRAGGPISVTSAASGLFSVFFSDLAPLLAGSGHPQVTAVGGNGHCLIKGWGAFGTDHLRVDVVCLDNNDGDLANRDFSILLLDEGGTGQTNRNLAFTSSAINVPVGEELDLTDSESTYNPGGGETILYHTDTGRYSIVFGRLGAVMHTAAHVQITPRTGAAMSPFVISCGLASQWEVASGNLAIPVACSDINGNPVNATFNVLVTSGEENQPGYTYALNDVLDDGSFTELTNDFVYNPWGPVLARRLNGLDGYLLHFRGVTTESGGNIVVTPAASPGSACIILQWGALNNGDGLTVRIRCFDEARTHVNAMFTVLYTHVDASPITDLDRFVAGNGEDRGNNCLDVAAPCATAAHAVRQASPGDTVVVAAGAYTESLTIDKSLTVRGAGPLSTTLQAHAEPFTASKRVLTITAGVSVAIAEMTIRHGQALGAAAAGQGGGILNASRALTLTNVIITGNVATSGGGLFNAGRAATLANVRFRDNSAELFGGGILHDRGALAITGAIFQGNEAAFGGGLSNGGRVLTLTNVTVSGNRAGSGGGGLFNQGDSRAALANTILWGNSAGDAGNELFNDPGSASVLRYSLYRDGAGDVVAGGGLAVDAHSLVADPLFAGAAQGNLHVQAGSPAVDGGDPATDLSLFPGGDAGAPLDLEGKPRVQAGRIDIGAFESAGRRPHRHYLPLARR